MNNMSTSINYNFIDGEHQLRATYADNSGAHYSADARGEDFSTVVTTLLNKMEEQETELANKRKLAQENALDDKINEVQNQIVKLQEQLRDLQTQKDKVKEPEETMDAADLVEDWEDILTDYLDRVGHSAAENWTKLFFRG